MTPVELVQLTSTTTSFLTKHDVQVGDIVLCWCHRSPKLMTENQCSLCDVQPVWMTVPIYGSMVLTYREVSFYARNAAFLSMFPDTPHNQNGNLVSAPDLKTITTDTQKTAFAFAFFESVTDQTWKIFAAHLPFIVQADPTGEMDEKAFCNIFEEKKNEWWATFETHLEKHRFLLRPRAHGNRDHNFAQLFLLFEKAVKLGGDSVLEFRSQLSMFVVQCFMNMKELCPFPQHNPQIIQLRNQLSLKLIE